MLEAIVAQLLIVYSVNVLLVVTDFSEFAQFFQCFLQMVVDQNFPQIFRTQKRFLDVI